MLKPDKQGRRKSQFEIELLRVPCLKKNTTRRTRLPRAVVNEKQRRSVQGPLLHDGRKPSNVVTPGDGPRKRASAPSAPASLSAGCSGGKSTKEQNSSREPVKNDIGALRVVRCIPCS